MTGSFMAPGFFELPHCAALTGIEEQGNYCGIHPHPRRESVWRGSGSMS